MASFTDLPPDIKAIILLFVIDSSHPARLLTTVRSNARVCKEFYRIYKKLSNWKLFVQGIHLPFFTIKKLPTHPVDIMMARSWKRYLILYKNNKCIARIIDNNGNTAFKNDGTTICSISPNYLLMTSQGFDVIYHEDIGKANIFYYARNDGPCTIKETSIGLILHNLNKGKVYLVKDGIRTKISLPREIYNCDWSGIIFDSKFVPWNDLFGQPVDRLHYNGISTGTHIVLYSYFFSGSIVARDSNTNQMLWTVSNINYYCFCVMDSFVSVGNSIIDIASGVQVTGCDKNICNITRRDSGYGYIAYYSG